MSNIYVFFDVVETGYDWAKGTPRTYQRTVGSFLSGKEAKACIRDYEERPVEPGYLYRYTIETRVEANAL